MNKIWQKNFLPVKVIRARWRRIYDPSIVLSLLHACSAHTKCGANALSEWWIIHINEIFNNQTESICHKTMEMAKLSCFDAQKVSPGEGTLLFRYRNTFNFIFHYDLSSFKISTLGFRLWIATRQIPTRLQSEAGTCGFWRKAPQIWMQNGQGKSSKNFNRIILKLYLRCHPVLVICWLMKSHSASEIAHSQILVNL